MQQQWTHTIQYFHFSCVGFTDCLKGAWLCPKCNHNKCTQPFNTVPTAFQFSRLLNMKNSWKTFLRVMMLTRVDIVKANFFWTVLTGFQAIPAMKGKLIQQSLAKTSQMLKTSLVLLLWKTLPYCCGMVPLFKPFSQTTTDFFVTGSGNKSFMAFHQFAKMWA